MRVLSGKLAQFILTPENRSASLAVQDVSDTISAERIPEHLNPLYLHGPAGSGKSHLVMGLIEEVTHERPDLVLAVCAAGDIDQRLPIVPNLENNEDTQPDDELPEELVAPLLQNARDADLIVIEDLQHLSPQTALSLAALLDRLRVREQQVVLTANAGPSQLRHRGERYPQRLLNRFAAGVVVGLDLPGPDSRLKLLREQAQRQQLNIDPEVLELLAAQLTGVRQLLAALGQVITLRNVYNKSLTVSIVAQELGLVATTTAPQLTLEKITERVSSYYQVERRHLQSQDRGRHILVPRQVSMYLARQLTELSLDEIGAFFGGRDHSTVLHACRKIAAALDSDATLSGAVRSLSAEMRG